MDRETIIYVGGIATGICIHHFVYNLCATLKGATMFSIEYIYEALRD